MTTDPVKHLDDPRAADDHAQIVATRGKGPVDPNATGAVIVGKAHPLSTTAGTPQTDTVAASENASDRAPPKVPSGTRA